MALRFTSNESLHFNSRRSPVISCNGAVASSQPLASEIGVQILKSGGNAADAAVGIAAALNVTEPCSTGIGGDCFCLFYDAKEKKVKGLNGSGRAPCQLSLDLLEQESINGNSLHPLSAHTVTVPGAAAAWVDTVNEFGSKRVSLLDILAPAIAMADSGFPVHSVAAEMWKKGEDCLLRNKYGFDMLLDGRAPTAGEIMRMPFLAQTFKEIAVKGKDGFYKGRVAEAVVDVVQKHGGVLSAKDLANHKSTFDEPICTNYRGINVWEMPPNGQGITALIALNILEGFDLKGMGYHSTSHLHTMIEAVRLAFSDTRWYIADPAHAFVPVHKLLSKLYADKRRTFINPNRALEEVHRGSPSSSSDTVYFTVVDQEGNACSFINSNYMGFGTGLVPKECGFTLQNRGANFSLIPGHPNALAPGKRPYHTIIPGMATYADSGELYASFGVMGGFMQPQGHAQVLVNMIDFGMDPQEALDMPRFCVGPGHEGAEGSVSLEEGISECTIEELKALGHVVNGPVMGYNRSLFGRGQIIARRLAKTPDGSYHPVYWTGSDPRADGMAIGF